MTNRNLARRLAAASIAMWATSAGCLEPSQTGGAATQVPDIAGSSETPSGDAASANGDAYPPAQADARFDRRPSTPPEPRVTVVELDVPRSRVAVADGGRLLALQLIDNAPSTPERPNTIVVDVDSGAITELAIGPVPAVTPRALSPGGSLFAWLSSVGANHATVGMQRLSTGEISVLTVPDPESISGAIGLVRLHQYATAAEVAPQVADFDTFIRLDNTSVFSRHDVLYQITGRGNAVVIGPAGGGPWTHLGYALFRNDTMLVDTVLGRTVMVGPRSAGHSVAALSQDRAHLYLKQWTEPQPGQYVSSVRYLHMPSGGEPEVLVADDTQWLYFGGTTDGGLRYAAAQDGADGYVHGLWRPDEGHVVLAESACAPRNANADYIVIHHYCSGYDPSAQARLVVRATTDGAVLLDSESEYEVLLLDDLLHYERGDTGSILVTLSDAQPREDILPKELTRRRIVDPLGVDGGPPGYYTFDDGHRMYRYTAAAGLEALPGQASEEATGHNVTILWASPWRLTLREDRDDGTARLVTSHFPAR